MATYIELHTLRGSSTLDALRQKINVAIAIKANALAKATPNAAQGAWAKAASRMLKKSTLYTRQPPIDNGNGGFGHPN